MELPVALSALQWGDAGTVLQGGAAAHRSGPYLPTTLLRVRPSCLPPPKDSTGLPPVHSQAAVGTPRGRSQAGQRPPPSGTASRSGCQLVCPGSPSSASTSQDQHHPSQPGVPSGPPGGVGAQTGIGLASPPSRQVPGRAAVARYLPWPSTRWPHP